MAKADIKAGAAYVSLYIKGTAFTKALKKAQKQLQEFGSGIARIGGVVSGMGAAITGSLTGAILHFASVGDALDKMSLRTGVSSTALAELGFAAEQSGASMETVESALQRMQRNLGEIGPESIKTAAALDAIGLSVDALQGMKPEDQFQLIAERIGDIADPSKRAAAAMAVFGQGGRQLLPMLENIRELRQEAKDLGIAPSPEQVAAAAQITDAINRVRRVIGAAIFEIGSSIAPMVQDVLAGFLQAVSAVRKFIVANRNLVVIAAKVGATLLVAGGAIAAIGAGFIGAGLAIGGVLSVVNAVYASFALMKTIAIALAGSLFVLRNAVIAARVAFTALTATIAAVRTAIISLAVASKAIVVSMVAMRTAVIGARAAMVSYAVALGSIRAAIAGVTVASIAATIATSSLAAVGAVMGALTSPILLAAAAVAAVGYAAFRTAGGLQGMSSAARSAFAETKSVASVFTTQFMELFGKLRQTATDTFGGIVEAIRAGDLSLAGQIAMVGLRLVFAQGLEAIHGLFGETIGTLVGQILSGDLLGAWTTLGSSMLASWVNVAKSIVNVFTSAIRGIDDAMDGLLTKFSKAAAIVGDGEGGIIKAAFASLIPAKEKDDPLNKALDSIDEAAQFVADASDLAVQDAVGGTAVATSQAVKDLQAELAALRKQAGEKVEAGRIGKPEEDDNEDFAPGQTRSGMGGRASAAVSNLAALASVASSPQDRQAKLQEQANKKHDKQIERLDLVIAAIDNQGLFHA